MGSQLPSFRFSKKARRTLPQPINFLISAALQDENVISLAAGLVDEETLPAEEVRRLSSELLTDEATAKRSLQYGDTAGLTALREAVVEHVCQLDGVSAGDLSITPHNVVLGSGSQQLLYIVSDILVDPGDIVITEWPSYFVFTGTLSSLGASVRAVEMDEQGMKLDALEATLEKLKRSGELEKVKIVYVCDYYQNPTGITLSEPRRRRLLELVRSYSSAHRICLLEDAAYRELSCEEAPPRTIKSYEADNAQVVLALTFSKPFAPGMRTGYAVLPDDLVEPVLNQKGNHDFGSSNFTQHLLLRALEGGTYHEHAEALRKRYRGKRDAMLEALQRHLGRLGVEGISWTRPGGGLYVYLTLPEWMDAGKDGELFSTALKEGVIYVPGGYCYGPDPERQAPTNHIRLTFGTVSASAVREGVARLARAIEKVASTGPGGVGAQRRAKAESE